MEIISITFLAALVLFIIYCFFKVIKSVITQPTKKVKLSIEQKQLKWSKIVYFICSAPILLLIIDSIRSLKSTFEQPISRFTYGHAEGELFAAVVILLLSCGYLMLNYNFIKVAFKQKIEGWKSIVFLSCLPGLAYTLTFVSAEVAVFGLVVLIIAPIMNAYILAESKKDKTTGKRPQHTIDDD